jgi:hypothetical protein
MPILATDRNAQTWEDRILKTWGLHILLGISAPVGVITGIWLIVALHGLHGQSLGEQLLRIGALAGIVAFATGVLLVAPLGLRLRRATKRLELAANGPDTATIAEVSHMNAWYRWASGLFIGSQWIALLGMSVFRYL